MGLPDRSPDPLVLRGLLQHLVPSAQAGHDCHPGLQRRSDGELGSDNLQRGCNIVRRGQVVEERQGICCSCRCPRACPPGDNIFENCFLKQNRSGSETLLPWSGGQTCGSMKGNHHFLTKRSKPNHQVCIVHRIHWDEPCESGNGNSRQICA